MTCDSYYETSQQLLTHSTTKDREIVRLIELFQEFRQDGGVQWRQRFFYFIRVFIIDIENKRKAAKRITSVELGKREPTYTKEGVRLPYTRQFVYILQCALTSNDCLVPFQSQDPKTCS
jgi:hypothetical protein